MAVTRNLTAGDSRTDQLAQRLIENCSGAIALRPFKVEDGKIIYLDNLNCE